MQTPGKWSATIPREPRPNAAWRLLVLENCRKDPEARALVHRMCREDFFFWCNTFAWQVNPEKMGNEIGPFVLHPFQETAAATIIDNLVHRRTTWVEKSRYQGATWLVLLIFVWACLFYEAKNFILISHTEQAVDKKQSPNTLFAKLRFVVKRLPAWMSRGADSSRLQFHFPATESTIDGYASVEHAAVGGRATGIFSDEHGLQQDGEAIRKNMGSVGPQVIVSAHYGQSGDFYDMVAQKGVDCIRMHWSDNPECSRGLYHWDADKREVVRHDDFRFPDDYPFDTTGRPTGGFAPGVRSPWYDLIAKERLFEDDQAVACQLDMDPTGASNLVFDTFAIAEQKRRYCAHGPTRVGRFLHEGTTPVGFEDAPNGPLKLWLDLKDGKPPPEAYFLGADVGTGSGGKQATPTCVSVVNRYGRKVAEFTRNDIEPRPFTHLAVALCHWFADETGRGAKFAWEINGPGTIVSKVINELGYANVYWRVINQNSRWRETESDLPGWVPTRENKYNLILNYSLALKNYRFQNYSLLALDECKLFEWGVGQKVTNAKEKGHRNPGMQGYNHADRVIADALAWMICEPFCRAEEMKPADHRPKNFYSTAQGLAVLLDRAESDTDEPGRPRWARTGRPRRF